MSLYRPRFVGRRFILASFGIFLVAAIALLAAIIAGGEDTPPVWFAVVWLGALGWNAYWWLFRIAVELETSESLLVARTPLRTLRVPLPDITRVSAPFWAPNVQAIRWHGGRPIYVIAGKGLGPFLRAALADRHDVSLNLGWQTRLVERFPGWSGFRSEK